VLAIKKVFRADPMVGVLAEYPEVAAKVESDDETNLWADSVGDAVGQLGLVVTLAIVARFALSLLSDLATALQ
jgi:hypothetical protein